MKKFLLLLLLPFFSFTSKEEKTMRLSGYFIVQCFQPPRNCPCGLDISSTDLISSRSSERSCLCDGNYYVNFALVKFVKPKDLDVNQIDVFDYQIKLERKEHLVLLSTNKNILLDGYARDSSLIKDSTLVKQVESDTTTAEMIRKLIDNANLPYDRMHHSFRVLLKGEVTVARMKNEEKSEQYLFLNDPTDHLEFVKVIKGL